MKKILLIAAIAVFGFTSVQAQEGGVKVGVNFGLPLGDIETFTSFNAGVDVAYMFAVADSFQVGPLVAYSHFFLKSDFDGDDSQYLPIAASARFYASEDLSFGADLGYALGITEGLDGGFYYRPKAAYNFGNIGLVLSYAGIAEENFSVASFNLGVEFGF